MAYVETNGLNWPWGRNINPWISSVTATLDAATEKFAMIGYLSINGHPGASKTLDTSGSSKISWQGGTTAVFDDVTSSLDVGIQGVNTSGPPAQPDGSYTVKAVVTTAADASPTLTTASAWHSVTPTTGTATLTEGDLIAIVWDLTARGGSDSISVGRSLPGIITNVPSTNAYAAAAWGATGVIGTPSATITFSDGTLGWIDGSQLFGLSSAQTFADATNPDERGMVFRVPFDCKVDAFVVCMNTAGATGDFTLYLSSGVSSGASTRSTITSVAVDGATFGVATNNGHVTIRMPTEQTLTADTDYCVSLKATGAGNVGWNIVTLGSADNRVAFGSNGTTLYGVTANGGGEFAAGSSTVMYPIAVRISSVSTGDSGPVGGLFSGNLRGNTQ
jgi:hypothetical protein